MDERIHPRCPLRDEIAERSSARRTRFNSARTTWTPFFGEARLADSDRAVYCAPYPDPPSRRPALQWPRKIPIDGEPADVAVVITRNGELARENAQRPQAAPHLRWDRAQQRAPSSWSGRAA